VAYQSYKDLEIYKKAHKLAIEIHNMSLKLPKFELYEEGSQIRKSSKSIKSNIVEGFGRRRYKQEFIRFLIYSVASCDETRNHLDTLYETKSLRNTESYESFCEEYDYLGKMISNFIKSVESGHKTRI
jgi:four helix bundle protein